MKRKSQTTAYNNWALCKVNLKNNFSSKERSLTMSMCKDRIRYGKKRGENQSK